MGQKEAQQIIWEDVTSILDRVGRREFTKLSGKRIIITGPSGLLASYIIDTIAYLNHNVLAVPCQVVGLGRSLVNAHSRLGHLLDWPGIELCQWDVKEPLSLIGPVDYIIHAAGYSAPSIFASDPVGTIDVNITALRWLLEQAGKKHSSRVIFFSSGETYGNPPIEHTPTPETYHGNTQPLGMRSCYTESKRCGEALCVAFFHQYGVPTQILRPFLVYGPGLDARADKRVMAEFIRQGITGNPIVLKDKGQALRTYCYITDAMELFWSIFFSDRVAEAFNIGGDIDEMVSIYRLAQLTHDICGINKEPHIELIENQSLASAPSTVCPDMRKAALLFGYEPKVSLRDGLIRTINWNKELWN